MPAADVLYRKARLRADIWLPAIVATWDTGISVARCGLRRTTGHVSIPPIHDRLGGSSDGNISGARYHVSAGCSYLHHQPLRALNLDGARTA
jgi:hypothetical protein